VLLFAVLLAPAVAQVYTWNGGNMSFDDPRNWADSVAPDSASNIPCATRFGSSSTYIISSLSAKRYYVGRRLILPRNGGLRLASGGSAISFAAPLDASQCNATSSTLSWVGGLSPARQNDFYCHENWLTDGFPADQPPCVNSVISFDAATSYKIGVDPSVKMVLVGSIRRGSTYITESNTDFRSLLPEIDLVDTSATVLAVASSPPICTNRNILQYEVKSNGRTSCLCFSSCPTPDMLLSYQQIIRQNSNTLATADRTAYFANSTRLYNGTYTPSALGVSSAVLSQNLANATQVAILSAAVQLAIVSRLPANSASITVLGTAAAGLRIAGVVSTFNGALYPPGTTSVPNPLAWSATAFPTLTASPIQNLISSTLTSLLLDYAADQLASQTASQRANLPTTINNAIDTILQSSNATQVLNVANSDPCFSTCTTDCNSCLASLIDSLNQTGVVSSEDAQTLADALIAAKNQVIADGGDWATTTSTITDLVTNTQQTTTLQQQSQAAEPQVYSMSSQPLGIARSRSAPDQLRAMMPENRAALMTLFNSYLRAMTSISDVRNVQATWTSNFNSGSRRRAVLTNSAISVTFDYNVSCLPTDTSCQTPATPTSPVGSSAVTALNNAFNLLSITPANCQSLAPNTPAYSYSCVLPLASAYCSALLPGLSVAVARVVTKNYIYNLTHCGTQPSFPDGSCYDTSAYSEMMAFAENVSTDCACVAATSAPPIINNNGGTGSGTPEASSSGGSGAGMPMIIGAAVGGIILLALIILLLLRRRRSRQTHDNSSKSVQDRTVVAFENPMYDDPAHVQPVYDSTLTGLGHGDSEGLYDEPAFNAGNKHNPIYQSHEDIIGGGGGGGGAGGGGDGYLDVAPGAVGAHGGAEDVGYLGAQAEAEDVGYLGGQEYQAIDEKQFRPQ